MLLRDIPKSWSLKKYLLQFLNKFNQNVNVLKKYLHREICVALIGNPKHSKMVEPCQNLKNWFEILEGFLKTNKMQYAVSLSAAFWWFSTTVTSTNSVLLEMKSHVIT